MTISRRPSFLAFLQRQPSQQQLGQREDDRGDDEQHQAQFQQRGLLQAARLIELVGQRGGDGIARRKSEPPRPRRNCR